MSLHRNGFRLICTNSDTGRYIFRYKRGDIIEFKCRYMDICNGRKGSNIYYVVFTDKCSATVTQVAEAFVTNCIEPILEISHNQCKYYALEVLHYTMDNEPSIVQQTVDSLNNTPVIVPTSVRDDVGGLPELLGGGVGGAAFREVRLFGRELPVFYTYNGFGQLPKTPLYAGDYTSVAFMLLNDKKQRGLLLNIKYHMFPLGQIDSTNSFINWFCNVLKNGFKVNNVLCLFVVKTEGYYGLVRDVLHMGVRVINKNKF